MITVRYSSVDGFKAKRTFKTVAAARAYAVARVGAGAEVSRSGYAISGDGVGKITVEGIDLGELLTGTKAASQGAYGLLRVYNCETHNGSDLIGRYDTVEEQMLALDRHAQHDDAECYHLAADLIDGRWVRIVPLYNGKTASEVMAETYPEGPF
jgi:hypothetical protein